MQKCAAPLRGQEARSRQNDCDRIDCDDLVIGIAQVGRGFAADVLTAAGFDPAALGSTPADA
ncbi:hypothetical protein [Streptomyces sp. SAS_272]|uniref:hypothetical protein n=1 Tax=Streptomyces sp. SAS_272 TaxID=3412747 RepID=UPI00403C1D2F